MRKELTEAQHKGMAESRKSVDLAILENKFKNISSQFVDNVSGELIQKLNHNIRNASVLSFDYGICPVGGNCEEGGEPIEGREGKYMPVAPGYLGRQNCTRCRFFVTGAPFLGGLKALADEIALEARIAASRMNEAQELMEALEDEQYDTEETGGRFEKQGELVRMRSLHNTTASKFDELAIDLIHTYRLADSSIKLVNQSINEGDKNLPMVTQGAELGLLPESVSILRSLDTVCKSAELYSFADPSRAIPNRSQILEALASDNDFHFGLFNLTDKQQLNAGNQITRLLMERLGSWDKLDRVADGENFLSDFINGGELKHLTRDLALLSNESIPGLKVIDGGKNV